MLMIKPSNNEVITRSHNRYFFEALREFGKKKNCMQLLEITSMAMGKGEKIAIEAVLELFDSLQEIDNQKYNIYNAFKQKAEEATEKFFVEYKDEIQKLPHTYTNRRKQDLRRMVNKSIYNGMLFGFKKITKLLMNQCPVIDKNRYISKTEM